MESISGPSRSLLIRLFGFVLVFGLMERLILPAHPLSPAELGNAPTSSQAQQDPFFPTASQTAASDPPQETAPNPNFSLSGTGTVNILLIGQDRMEGENRTRSDTILLCTFHKAEKRLIMTSFLRDLYVEIPGHGKNRINASYAFGGPELLTQTLEENFGIIPDGSLEVDFSGFTEIIDTLGGVTLLLRQDEAEAINQKTSGTLAEGTHTLTGEEALAYARIRKLDADGDFSRTSRQRKLLEAILNSCRNSSTGTLLTLMKQLLPLVDSDIPTRKLLRLALEVLPLLQDMEIDGQQIPEEGNFSYDTIRGMSVLIPDLEAARQRLRDTIQPSGES